MSLQHFAQTQELILDFRTIREPDMNSFHCLLLDLSQRFDLTDTEFRALITTVNRSTEANQPFRCDQITCRLKEIREYDHFHRALEIFQRQIGHPVALLRQRRFDRSHDAAELHLFTVR